MERLPEPTDLTDRLADWNLRLPEGSRWTVTADWEPDRRSGLDWFAPDALSPEQRAAHAAGKWTLVVATVRVMDGEKQVYFWSEVALLPQDAVTDRTLSGLTAQAIAGAVRDSRA